MTFVIALQFLLWYLYVSNVLEIKQFENQHTIQYHDQYMVQYGAKKNQLNNEFLKKF